MSVDPQEDPYASIIADLNGGGTPFDRLNKEFQRNHGRPLRQTGGDTAEHIRLHGKGKAWDVGARDLSPEEMDFVLGQAPRMGLNVSDYSKATPHTTRTGVRITGPHIHLDTDQPKTKPGAITKSDSSDPYASVIADLGSNRRPEPPIFTPVAAPTEAQASPVPSLVPESRQGVVPPPEGQLPIAETNLDMLPRVQPAVDRAGAEFSDLITGRLDAARKELRKPPGQRVATQAGIEAVRQGVNAPQETMDVRAGLDTGEPIPGESQAESDARAARAAIGPDPELEGDVYREWTSAMKSGDFGKASQAAQIYEQRFPKGGKYAKHIYDPVSGVGAVPVSQQKEAREGAVAVSIGDLSNLTGEDFRQAVEKRFREGLGFDESTYEVFKQKTGYDPAATSGYGQGREQIKQSAEEFERSVRGSAGEDETILIRVPKQSAEKIQGFFNDKSIADPSLAQAEAVNLEGRTGFAKTVEKYLGKEFTQGSQQFAAGMTQGMVGTMGGAAKGAGILLREAAKKINGDSPTPISDMLIGSGDWLNRFTQSASFEDADPDGSVLSTFKLGQGLGSGATFALTGVAGKIGAGIAGALSQAGSAYDETYKHMLDRGYSKEQAHKVAINAAILNIPIGATEMMGVGGSLERVLEGGVPGAGFARNLLASTIRGAIEEGSQENLQQRLGNIVAQVSGDPNRPLSEGEASAVLVALFTGGLMEGGMHAAVGKEGTQEAVKRPSVNLLESVPGRASGRPGIAKNGPTEREPTTRLRSLPQAAHGDAAIPQGVMNTSRADTKNLFDIANGATFRDHGLSGFDIPSQRAVMSLVLRALHDPKIHDIVVQLVPVNVVDDLTGIKTPTNVSLHDKTVLKDVLAVDPEGSTSIRSDVADTLVRSTAGVATERAPSVSSDLAGLSPDLAAAVKTELNDGASERAIAGSTAERPGSSSTEGQTTVKAGTVNLGHDVAPSSDVVSGASEVQSDAPSILPPKETPEELATVDEAAHEAATSPKNDLAQPTRAQLVAGNFAHGHVKVAGMDVAIENPAGSVRSGVGEGGRPWQVRMKHHYGYVKSSTGADGEQVDVFLKNGMSSNYSGPVFVVNQNKADGSFDEHKAMLGFPTEAAAKTGYLANYKLGWKGLGSITRFENPEQFKEWVKTADLKAPAQSKGAITPVVPPTKEAEIVSESEPTSPGVIGKILKERAKAGTDEQTGLRSKNEWLKAKERVDADPNREVAVLDVNDLKTFNDSQGHEVGDEYLAHVGKVAIEEAGKAGISPRQVFRVGGDEITIDAPKGKAEVVIDAIKKRVAEFERGGLNGSIAGGVGETTHAADQRMYIDKGLMKATQKQAATAARAEQFKADVAKRKAEKAPAEIQRRNTEAATLLKKGFTRETIGKMESADRAKYAAMETPRLVYRARTVGDQGVKSGSKSQATSSLTKAREYAEVRGQAKDVGGRQQEIVAIDVSKLPAGSYELSPAPDGQLWLNTKKDIPESAVTIERRNRERSPGEKKPEAKPATPRDAFAAAVKARIPEKLFQEKHTPLLTAIRRAGGIDPNTQEGKDIARYFSKKEGGQNLMIKGGAKVDQLVRSLREEYGFPFTEEDDPLHNPVGELLNAMQQEAKGKPFRSLEDMATDFEDEADRYFAEQQGLDNPEDFKVIAGLDNKSWFDLHEKIINETTEPTTKEVSKFRALSRLVGLSQGGIESILEAGRVGRSGSATEYDFEDERNALAAQRAEIEARPKSPYQQIPLPVEVKEPLLAMARKFFKENRTDYDALAQEYQDALGDDYILVADHLPAIFALAEPAEKEVAQNLTDLKEVIADSKNAGELEGGRLTESELKWIAERRRRDVEFQNSRQAAIEAKGPGAYSGRALTKAEAARRKSARTPEGLPGVTTATNRTEFKDALIKNWRVDPEVAHRASEIMEALASQYAVDAKASDPKVDTAAAKRSVYERVKVASGAVSTDALQQNRTLREDVKKYKTLEAFARDYTILYHGGSENIIGDKLVTGGRVVGEVTKENLGRGQDYGGIFFTPEAELARTFERHAPGGKGGVHTFLVKTSGLFDERKVIDRAKLKAFIGKSYTDVDGETVEFTQQMYDFVFPKLHDGQRHMDWATFDGDILKAMGYEGANVVEHFGSYGEGKHLYTTVLFEGGKESPHWRVPEGTTVKDAYEQAKSGALRQEAFGATSFTKSGEAIIHGFEANPSTAPHEIVHAVLPLIADLANQPNAPGSLKIAVRDIVQSAGFKDTAEYLRQHQAWVSDTGSTEDKQSYRAGSEKAAEGFEGYLREGKAPTKALESAFAKFKEWLSQIYRHIRESMKLTDKQRRAWDRLLGSEREKAASKIDESKHWNFGRSSFATPEVESNFRAIVREAAVESGGAHKVPVSRTAHLERVANLSPDLIPEIRKIRESQIVSREVFTAASQYAQTLTKQAQELRDLIRPDTLPDEALRLEDRIAALEHDATEVMSHTIGVRSEFGRNLALLATQKTDQLSPERVLAYGKSLAEQRGMDQTGQPWKTRARKLVGLSNEIQGAQKERQRIAKERKSIEKGTETQKRKPWQAVMLEGLKAQAVGASARLQEQFGKRLYQKSQTDSPEFKRWFGESKVVDEKGEPLVVYHGTSADFGEFRKSDVTLNYDNAQRGLGHFFTNDARLAGKFARGQGGQVIPSYLSLQDPKIEPPIRGMSKTDVIEHDWRDEDVEEYVAELKRQGHDGIIFQTSPERTAFSGFTEFVAFKSTQIKSAIGNRGTFDPNNPNILFQKRELPTAAHDIATVLAARIAEEGQKKTGTDLTRMVEELRSDYPDIVNEYEPQIKEAADSILKEARRSALLSASRDPQQRASARQELAKEVNDAKRVSKEAERNLATKTRQMDAAWERDASQAEKEAGTAWDKANSEWQKSMEASATAANEAEKQATAFSESQKREGEAAEARRLREEWIAEAKDQKENWLAGEKESARQQRTSAIEEARRMKRAAVEVEKDRLRGIAEEAHDELRRVREAVAEATRSENRWDYPITQAAENARANLSDPNYKPTIEDMAAVMADKSLDPAMTPQRLHAEMTGYGEAYAKNARAIRDAAAELKASARKTFTQRRFEEVAAGKATGVTKPAEQRQARQDYQTWAAERLEELAAEEAYQNRRERTARRDLARELAKLQKMSALDKTLDLLGLPISLASSVDLPHLRQGLPTLMNHPKIWFESFLKSTSTWTAAQMEKRLDEMENSPLADLARMSGLKQSGLESRRAPLSRLAREEQFQNRFAQMFPHVRVSERQYTTGMDVMRSKTFELHAQKLLNEFPPASSPELYSELARITNIMTGVGDLGSFTKYAPFLNRLVLYATRYMVSRFQILGMLRSPLFYRDQPWTVRKVAAKEAWGYVGKMTLLFGAAAALGLTSLDVDDDDFLKFKIPSTNQKWDLTGGMGGYVKFLFKMARSAYRMGTKQREFKGDSMWSTVKDFSRSKLAPAAGTVVDVGTGSTFIGEPFTWKNKASELVTPMVARDIYDAIKLDGARGAIMIPFGLLGGNVSTFRPKKAPDRTGSQAERYATGMLRERMGEKPETPEGYKRRSLITQLGVARKSGDLRNAIAITKELEQSGGELTAKEKESLEERIKHTPLEHAYKYLGGDEKQEVLKVATPEEREKIEPKWRTIDERVREMVKSDAYQEMSEPEKQEALKGLIKAARAEKVDVEDQAMSPTAAVVSQEIRSTKTRMVFAVSSLPGYSELTESQKTAARKQALRAFDYLKVTSETDATEMRAALKEIEQEVRRQLTEFIQAAREQKPTKAQR